MQGSNNIIHLIYLNVDRDSYKKVLMESTMKKRDQYGEFLDSLSILGIKCLHSAVDNILTDELDKWERLTIADALEEVEFDGGHQIITKGDNGKDFFFILEG